MNDRTWMLNPRSGSRVASARPAGSIRGIWRRILGGAARIVRRLLVRKRSVAVPVTLDVRKHDDEFALETPAQGEAFTFQIKVRCSWHVPDAEARAERRLTSWEIQDFIERSRTTAQSTLEDLIRPAARQFPPHRAAEAEQALNKAVAGCLDGGNVRVTVRVRVEVCSAIRQKLELEWEDRLKKDVADDTQKAHVQALRDLQEEWRKLLVAGLEGIGAVPEAKTEWLAPYALALAENPKGASEQLRKVLEDRVSQTETLLKNLIQTSLDGRMDALEFAYQSESTLRALLVYLGVPVPSANGGPGESRETSPNVA
jgi:hypothetical protein